MLIDAIQNGLIFRNKVLLYTCILNCKAYSKVRKQYGKHPELVLKIALDDTSFGGGCFFLGYRGKLIIFDKWIQSHVQVFSANLAFLLAAS